MPFFVIALLMLASPGAIAQIKCADVFNRSLTAIVTGSPVNQGQWRQVALLSQKNPNFLRIGTMEFSKVKGDTLPVESVSYSGALLWIKALNELSKNGEPGLAKILPGHNDGDQYRLPTETELNQVGLKTEMWEMTQDNAANPGEIASGNYKVIRRGHEARTGMYMYYAGSNVGFRLVRD